MFLALLAPTVTEADDWPHWRGPNRNDVVAESSGWNGNRWLAGDAAWSKNVGVGCTSPIVVDGRLYTMGWRAGKDTLVCLDAATGNELWRVSYACPEYGRRSTGDKGVYAGVCSTPEIDEETGFLFTLSIDGDLNCWNTEKRGEHVWGINLYDRYQVKQRPDVSSTRKDTLRDYGYTSSPLVHNDWVVVEVGDDEGNLMAFDKRTGARRWASECRDEAGHTGGPVPIAVEGVPCVAVLTLRNLVVTRMDQGNEGKTSAQYEWTTDFANNIATPAVHDNHVIITSAYNHYAICKLRITLSGATKVWQQDNPSGVCSPVIHKGHVYWAWRGVHCLDFETGHEKWVGGNVGSQGSCIVTADDRLIVWSNRGDLNLLETAGRSSDKYTMLASKAGIFAADAWPHVVLANGRLYVKDRGGNLKCFSLAAADNMDAQPTGGGGP